MTTDEFRRIALSLPDVTGSAHMHHPDFRVRGKIFATLGYPDESWGMVKLTPEQQQDYVRRLPRVFEPAAGSWGRQGSTLVRLDAADETVLHEALTLAWERVPQKPSVKEPKKATRFRRYLN